MDLRLPNADIFTLPWPPPPCDGGFEHGHIYACGLDGNHTPVGYKIEFKGGNSPPVLCQQRPVGPLLPFNQSKLCCVCDVLEKGEKKRARAVRCERASVCVCMCAVFGFTRWGQLYVQQK